MAIRISNDGDYRRGLILGLTMAEVLILLLFLLLLLLAANFRNLENKILDWHNRYSELKNEKEDLQEEIYDLKKLNLKFSSFAGMSPFEVNQLISEKESLENFRKKNEALSDQLKEYFEIKKLISIGSGFNPDDPPPAIIKRGLKSLQILGPTLSETELEKVLIDFQDKRKFDKFAIELNPKLSPNITILEALNNLVESKEGNHNKTIEPDKEVISNLKRKLEEKQKEIDQILAQKHTLEQQKIHLIKSSGNGLTMPPCWPDKNNKSQYIFNISITDSGVIVSDSAPPERKDDLAWEKIDLIKFDQEIEAEDFYNSTLRLRRYSDELTCRYYVRIKDNTSATNKAQYKNAKRLVESNFYFFERQN